MTQIIPAFDVIVAITTQKYCRPPTNRAHITTTSHPSNLDRSQTRIYKLETK